MQKLENNSSCFQAVGSKQPQAWGRQAAAPIQPGCCKATDKTGKATRVLPWFHVPQQNGEYTIFGHCIHAGICTSICEKEPSYCSCVLSAVTARFSPQLREALKRNSTVPKHPPTARSYYCKSIKKYFTVRYSVLKSTLQCTSSTDHTENDLTAWASGVAFLKSFCLKTESHTANSRVLPFWHPRKRASVSLQLQN